MQKYIFLTIISLLLAACGSSTPFHTILGATVGYAGDKVTIISDAQVGEFRVRRVSVIDSDCRTGYTEHLELSGNIGPDSTALVARLLPKLSKLCVNTVYLNSNGGLLEDGFKMGDLFRQYRVSSRVSKGQTCSSACAVAFLGGKFRSVETGGKLVFHAPYLETWSGIDCSDTGQVSVLKKYYQKMIGQEAGSYLLKRTMNFCTSTGGWVLNSGGAKMMGITN